MGKFKEILRTGALLSGMLTSEGAKGQEPIRQSQQAQVSPDAKNNETDPKAESGKEKTKALNLEEFKTELKGLGRNENNGEYSETYFLHEAIARYDEYKHFSGAEEFVIECGKKYLKEHPQYFFESFERVKNPLPQKLGELVIQATKLYPIFALQANQILVKFDKIYPEIVIATLNKDLLAKSDLLNIESAFSKILGAKATHPVTEILREILDEKFKNKARENPDEILQLAMGNLNEWTQKVFIDEKRKEEFLYILLSALIGKGSIDEIFSDFNLFAEYELCRSLLLSMAQQFPERILQRSEMDLGAVSLNGDSAADMPKDLSNFYLTLLSEALLKAKVGQGEEEYYPVKQNWMIIKYLFPDFYEQQRRKFVSSTELKDIFGKDADLRLPEELITLLKDKNENEH